MKMIATISDRTDGTDKIRQMLDCGVTIFRYVFLKGVQGMDKLEKKVEVPRSLSADTEIMIDIPGYKVRLGKFIGTPNNASEIRVHAGDDCLFRGVDATDDYKNYIPINVTNLGQRVSTGDLIYTNDGEGAFRVTKILDENNICGEALIDTSIRGQMGVRLGNEPLSIHDCFDAVIDAIAEVSRLRPEIICLSFVDDADFLAKIMDVITNMSVTNWNPKLYSKIESDPGIDNIEEIAEHSDGVIIARGDMPLYSDYAALGLYQKRITKFVSRKKKDVFLATQVIESTKDLYIPYRPEICDLTNFFLDGGNGVQFGKETTQFSDVTRPLTIVKEIYKRVASGSGLKS